MLVQLRGSTYLAAWRAWTRPAAYSVAFPGMVPLVVAFCAETEATATSTAVRKALIDMFAALCGRRNKRRKKLRGLKSKSCHRRPFIEVGPSLGGSSSADRHGSLFYSPLRERARCPATGAVQAYISPTPISVSTASSNKRAVKVVRGCNPFRAQSRELFEKVHSRARPACRCAML